MKTPKKTQTASPMRLFPLYCAVIITALFITPVFAEDSSNMMAGFWSWYSLLRRIATPLLIVSIAACGFKLAVGCMSGSFVQVWDAVKKQMLYSVLALFVLIFIPYLMESVLNLVKSSGWKPLQP